MIDHGVQTGRQLNINVLWLWCLGGERRQATISLWFTDRFVSALLVPEIETCQ